jgi:threonine dehydratase
MDKETASNYDKWADAVKIEDILHAKQVLKDVITRTPLHKDHALSARYGCQVYLKREDLQIVRSFKIRGAYHFIRSLPEESAERGVVCASAGNHAQGVAYTCQALRIKGYIYMPATTPRQKVSQVKRFGGSYVEIVLVGDTFDDAYMEAVRASERQGLTFVHPFNDPKIIAGNGTIAMEILQEAEGQVDYIFCAVGGGGLASGIGRYVKAISPETRIIGVEPSGAPAMHRAIAAGGVQTLETIDRFVDGAAVKRVGELTYNICKETLDDIVLVPEGKVCTTILELYNQSAIIAEPAGALPVSALDAYRDKIEGKTVVCLISGGNNDVDRMQEIKERSLIHEGLKHYFTINFPQRAGALREFLDKVLGPNDDITRFEYIKKNNKENGPALVGIELKSREDYEPLLERMKKNNYTYIELNKDPLLFDLLI